MRLPLPSLDAAYALVAKRCSKPAFPRPAAIGHRMVCGGPTVTENQRITPALIDEMERYTAFAPLHTPVAIYIMRQVMREFPDVPNFVCLDSYFHRNLPEVAHASAYSGGVFRDGRAAFWRAWALVRVDRRPPAAVSCRRG
jgi:acetate kinase